jgi:hypothetical protein
VSIGENITTMISFQTPKYYNATTYYVNLTVAGVARLTDEGYALLSGNDWFYRTALSTEATL